MGIGALPFILLRKPAKDWMIVFFLTGFFANLLDEFMVKSKRVIYPVRLFEKYSDKSILFDFLIFPICCTLFIQATYQSKLPAILGKAFLFSVPLTAFEWLLEQKTHLIKWIRWSTTHTLVSVTLYLLTTRLVIAIIRKSKRLGFLSNNTNTGN
ncbi:CBO0543 family protein [Oceanobacillus caeni]|uniref:CBO0543 family protein n=1 Tax=Oceanobacillus caeni TaxID=405946 RepID=UPI0019574B3B